MIKLRSLILNTINIRCIKCMKNNIFSELVYSAPAKAGLPFGSLNRKICNSIMLAQISTFIGTSHISQQLFKILNPAFRNT